MFLIIVVTVLLCVSGTMGDCLDRLLVVCNGNTIAGTDELREINIEVREREGDALQPCDFVGCRGEVKTVSGLDGIFGEDYIIVETSHKNQSIGVLLL